MRRSTAVRLVVIGATGLGLAAYGLQHGPGTPAAQPARCDDNRDDPACNKPGQGSHGGGGAGGGAAGAAGRDQTEGRARAGVGEAGEATASHGVARGGFGEAGGAHGGGGGE